MSDVRLTSKHVKLVSSFHQIGALIEVKTPVTDVEAEK